MKDNTKALLTFMKADLGAQFLIAFFGSVLSAMTGNAYFEALQPMLGDLAVQLADFKTAWEKGQVGTESERKSAVALKLALQQAFKVLCNSTNVSANGSRIILLTTAFELSKETRTKMVLLLPRKFTVVNTKNQGEFYATFDRQRGTKGTNFDHTLDENPGKDSVWVSSNCSDPECVIGGFTPGQKVTFRVSVTGPHGQKQISEYITKTANYGL